MTIVEGTISRIHAEFEYTAQGKLMIKDLGSGKIIIYIIFPLANGTYLEGEQLKAQKAYPVKVNDKINLGESKKFLQVKGKIYNR